MADESDVEQALVDLIDADLYPNGPGGADGPPHPTKIYAGWPVSRVLETETKAGKVHVSVYAVPGSNADVGQPFNTEPVVLQPPVHGLSVANAGRAAVFSGTPNVGEYATAVIGGAGYSYAAQIGDTAATVAQGLAAALAADYPLATASGTTLSLPSGPDVAVRIGAPALMGERIHRQRQQFRIVTWASKPGPRTTIAKRVDLALKRQNVIRLPDTTQATLVSVGSNPSDAHQLDAIYRRDLIFNVTYDTLGTYTAYEITHVVIDDSPDIFR